MSTTALAKSPDTAEDRLIQAIKRFEAQLSPEQRKLYDENQSLCPLTSDVSKLLVEVDRQVKAKHSTRTAFKPRLESVILAIQKFASIADILIGGSQNLVACGVWSIARIALLASTSSLSTIEELSPLFMAVGASAPYHDEIALLYPQSKRLRTFIHEYHIVVVEICRQLLIAVSKSVLGKLRFAFSDQNYRAQLERWGTGISREIQLYMAKNLKEQASETSRFRSNVLQRFTEDRHSQQMKARYKILKACSTYEYRSSLQQLEKVGVAEFFLSEPAYLDWRRKAGSTLLINGKLGAGKSVLAASIVKDITANGHDVIVGYFFCRHDIPQSLKARTISGALCKQILEPIVDLSVYGILLRSFTQPLDLAAIKSIILRALPTSADVYLIMDGLDECEETDQKQIIELLEFLQKSLRFHICLSCRTRPDPPSWTSGWLQRYQLSIPENNPDIHSYIRLELARRLEIGTLKLIDPTLIEEIYTTLYDGANGMFLWVALQIDCICYEETDERIRGSLGRLPKTLPELYARILSRAAEGDTYHDQDRVFRLILAALRPLRKDELEEALSVVPGDTKYDSKRRIHNVDRLLRRCASLVIVDEEYHTVQLIHQSAKAYLMTDHNSNDSVSMSEDSVHQAMADIIVTYLSYGEFDRQVSTNVLTPISAHAIQKKVVEAVLPSSIGKLAALRLLHKISGADIDLAPALNVQDITELGQNHVQFPFRSYADDHFALHALFYDLRNLAWRRPLLLNLAGNKKTAMFEMMTTEVAVNRGSLASKPYFTWGDCPLNDLALTGLQLTSLIHDVKPFILTRDGNQQYLIDWCLDNNFWRLAYLYWSTYRLYCLEHERKNPYDSQNATEFLKWFRLAAMKGYMTLASELYYRSFWERQPVPTGPVLTRLVPPRSYLERPGRHIEMFHDTLKILWEQERYEALKWIGNHIVNAHSTLVERGKYVSEHQSVKVYSGAPTLHEADMWNWLFRKPHISDGAIDAFRIVVYVTIIDNLCIETCKQLASNDNKLQYLSILRRATSPGVRLQHVQEWEDHELWCAAVLLEQMADGLNKFYIYRSPTPAFVERCVHVIECAVTTRRPDMRWLRENFPSEMDSPNERLELPLSSHVHQ